MQTGRVHIRVNAALTGKRKHTYNKPIPKEGKQGCYNRKIYYNSFFVACILLPNDAIDYGTAEIAIINSSGVIAWENKTLICYVNYFELQKVKEIISRNKGSFSTVSTSDEILR